MTGYVCWVICHIGTHIYDTPRHIYQLIEIHTCIGLAYVHMNKDTVLSLIQADKVTHHLLCN